MFYNEFGRTGLKVSALGIGAGGPSRLGLARNSSNRSAIRLIHFGLDRGINFIDTAATYGTEELVGAAIDGCRSRVILSTKASLGPHFGALDDSRIASRLSARLGEELAFVTSGRAIEDRVHASLRRLKTDYIDIFSLHSVVPSQIGRALERALPILVRLQECGKIRYIGISEAFQRDKLHSTLMRAASTGLFDSIMVGFNYLYQSGASIVPIAKAHRSGIVAMHAVRGLHELESLQGLLARQSTDACSVQAPRDAASIITLLNDHGVFNLAGAAIRFARHELNAEVVLSGTGDETHLAANIAACLSDALPDPVIFKLREMFADNSKLRRRRFELPAWK